MSQIELDLGNDVVISVNSQYVILEREGNVIEIDIEEINSFSFHVEKQYIQIDKRVKKKIESERFYYTESQKNAVGDFHYELRELLL